MVASLCQVVCVCVHICACVHMSDEVFGNQRVGLIITDISLDAFRPISSWEQPASRLQSEKRKDEREGS